MNWYQTETELEKHEKIVLVARPGQHKISDFSLMNLGVCFNVGYGAGPVNVFCSPLEHVILKPSLFVVRWFTVGETPASIGRSTVTEKAGFYEIF